MESMTEEKRVCNRIPYLCSTTYKMMGSMVCPPDEAEVHGEILDASDSGLKIRVDSRVLEPGTVIRIRVPIDAKSNSSPGATIPILAEVRWVRDNAVKDLLVGVRFLV